MEIQHYPVSDKRSATPVIGGILSIIAIGITIMSIFGPVLFFLIRSDFHVPFSRPATTIELLRLLFYGVILVISGTLGVVGGVLAIKRKRWLLSLVGVVASIISFAPPLGIIATILVAISKKEFNKLPVA